MPEYRIYTLVGGNHIAGPPRTVTCDTDQEAIAQAKTYLDGSDIEVWQAARIVTRLRSQDDK